MKKHTEERLNTRSKNDKVCRNMYALHTHRYMVHKDREEKKYYPEKRNYRLKDRNSKTKTTIQQIG